MSIAEGYATWTDKESGKLLGEARTIGCAHCQRLIIFHNASGASIGSGAHRVSGASPKHDPGGRCPMCDAAVCGPCVDQLDKTLKCTPFEKRLEQMESSGRLLKAMGIEP